MNIKLADFDLMPEYILRTPLHSWTMVEQLLKLSDRESTERLMRRLYSDIETRHALFIASQEFYKIMDYWLSHQDLRADDRTLLSLMKYLVRMGIRCTPFGLFAGVSLGNFSKETRLTLADHDQIKKFCSLDMEYLFNIKDRILQDDVVSENIKWFPNSTLYAAGNIYKFIDYSSSPVRRVFGLSTVVRTDYLESVLMYSRSGKTKTEIANILTSSDITVEDAREYIGLLTEKQILQSELEPILVDGSYLHQFTEALKRIANDKEYAPKLELAAINDVLDEINNKSDFDSKRYEALKFQSVKPLHEPYRLFQVDTIKPLLEAGLNENIGFDVRRAMEVLNKLRRTSDDTPLNNFRRKFLERFEYREVSLMEALDPELGISYSNSNVKDFTPLLQHIHFENRNDTGRQLNWLKRDRHLMRRLNNALAANHYQIEIKDEELQGFESNWKNIPDTFSMLITLNQVSDGTVEKEFINLVGGVGSSAINIFSRFTHLDPALRNLSKDISELEDGFNSGVIVAELAYLPDHTRMGNIMQRSSPRKFKIAFLSGQSQAGTDQLDLGDLMVSIKDGRFLIRSASLNKEVKIKLTNSHRFDLDTHPVYNFLGDLQYEGLNWPLFFDWGPLANDYQFLPRVTYKNVILAPASWNLQKEDLRDFQNSKSDIAFNQLLSTLETRWHFPHRFLIADADNHLLIDLHNEVSRQLFRDVITKREGIRILEFMEPSKNAVHNTSGEPYLNEIALLFCRKPKVPDPTQKTFYFPTGKVQRTFLPGDQWLYFKLVAGTKSADTLLLNPIRELVEVLLSRKLIDKWFFIRYYDPNYHVRLRFNVTGDNYGTVISLLNEKLAPWIENMSLQKVLLDTYVRELERYGESTISDIESIFSIDSQVSLTILNLFDKTDNKEDYRWLYLFVASDQMMNDFQLTGEQKFNLIKQLDKNARRNSMTKQLSAKFKEIKPKLTAVLDRQIIDPVWDQVYHIHEAKTNSMLPICIKLKEADRNRKLAVDYNQIIASCIHLMINRVCLTRPNNHETIVYDFLFRYYSSVRAVREGALSHD